MNTYLLMSINHVYACVYAHVRCCVYNACILGTPILTRPSTHRRIHQDSGGTPQHRFDMFRRWRVHVPPPHNWRSQCIHGKHCACHPPKRCLLDRTPAARARSRGCNHAVGSFDTAAPPPMHAGSIIRRPPILRGCAHVLPLTKSSSLSPALTFGKLRTHSQNECTNSKLNFKTNPTLGGIYINRSTCVQEWCEARLPEQIGSNCELGFNFACFTGGIGVRAQGVAMWRGAIAYSV